MASGSDGPADRQSAEGGKRSSSRIKLLPQIRYDQGSRNDEIDQSELSATTPYLKFAVEMTFDLQMTGRRHKLEWNEAAKRLETILLEGLTSPVKVNKEAEIEDWSSWYIRPDEHDHGKNDEPVSSFRLRSPAMMFQNMPGKTGNTDMVGLWCQSVEKIWKLIDGANLWPKKNVHVEQPVCGTRVYIFPAGENSFSLDHVKNLAKATLIFERHWDSLWDAHRRYSPDCKSIQHNATFQSDMQRGNRRASFDKITKAADFQGIISLLNPADIIETDFNGRIYGPFTQNASVETTIYPRISLHGRRQAEHRWDFTHLSNGRSPSVCYRQPPASTDASFTKMVIKATCCFAAMALGTPTNTWTHDQPKGAERKSDELDRLKSMIRDGARAANISTTDGSHRWLDDLFDGKQALPAARFDMKILDDDFVREEQFPKHVRGAAAEMKELGLRDYVLRRAFKAVGLTTEQLTIQSFRSRFISDASVGGEQEEEFFASYGYR